jgi:hypothetical protein
MLLEKVEDHPILQEKAADLPILPVKVDVHLTLLEKEEDLLTLRVTAADLDTLQESVLRLRQRMLLSKKVLGMSLIKKSQKLLMKKQDSRSSAILNRHEREQPLSAHSTSAIVKDFAMILMTKSGERDGLLISSVH